MAIRALVAAFPLLVWADRHPRLTGFTRGRPLAEESADTDTGHPEMAAY